MPLIKNEHHPCSRVIIPEIPEKSAIGNRGYLLYNTIPQHLPEPPNIIQTFCERPVLLSRFRQPPALNTPHRNRLSCAYHSPLPHPSIYSPEFTGAVHLLPPSHRCETLHSPAPTPRML